MKIGEKLLILSCMLLLATPLYAGYWDSASVQAEIDALTGTQATYGNELDILPEATEDYALRNSMIDQAMQHINIYTLYFSNSDTSLETIDQLIFKVTIDEVDANLIYHPISQVGFGKYSLITLLNNAGINTRGFWAQNVGLLDAYNKLLIGCHKKLLMVDSEFGLEAIVGGRNIGDEYLANIPEYAGQTLPNGIDPETGAFTNMWRDTDIHVRGEICYDLQDDFISTFNRLGGEPLDPAGYFPELAVDQSSPNYREVDVRMLQNEPDLDLYQINDMYRMIMEEAQSSIVIETPYFIPQDYQIEGLIAAAQRGVDVTILTNSENTNDLGKPLTLASANCWGELLDAGVRIFLWDIPRSELDDSIFRTLHSKIVIADGELFMPGSWNFDGRAHNHENEYAFAITDEAVVAEAVAMLNRDIYGHGHAVIEVTPQWMKGHFSWWDRIMMRVLAKFSWVL